MTTIWVIVVLLVQAVDWHLGQAAILGVGQNQAYLVPQAFLAQPMRSLQHYRYIVWPVEPIAETSGIGIILQLAKI